MPTVDGIMEILDQRGSDDRYGSEKINQLEHGLQCAWLAEREGAEPALITAALLHDIGHLIHKYGDDAAERGIDDRHEVLGAKYLTSLFSENVTQPIAMHVDAKRYLCANEPGYFELLSEGSVRSLELQGGPMSEDESAAFIARDYAEGAISVRRWDDNAKVQDLLTPDLTYFRRYVDRSRVDKADEIAA